MACEETPRVLTRVGGTVRPGGSRLGGVEGRGQRRGGPRRTGGGSPAKRGGRLERGAPSCGETGDGTSALCRGAEPGAHRAPWKEERFRSEAGRGDWRTQPEGRDAEVKRAAEDQHRLEKLTKLGVTGQGRSWSRGSLGKFPAGTEQDPGILPKVDLGVLAFLQTPWKSSTDPCGSSPCPPTWPKRRRRKRRKLPKRGSGPGRGMKKTEMLPQNHRWQRRETRGSMARRPQVR